MIKWQTTGVGSVPFKDSSEAIEYIFSSYSIPFYPQLVKNDRYAASSLPQGLQEVVPSPILQLFLEKSDCIKDHVQLDVRWKQEILPHLETLPGITEFTRRLSKFTGTFYKVQFLAPNTANYILETIYGQQLYPALRSTIEKNISLMIEEFLKKFSNANMQSILILDDPLGPNINLLKNFTLPNSLVGIHCCANFSLADIVSSLIKKYLSFDVSLMRPYASEFESINFLARHGGVILGIVDTKLKDINEKDSENAFETIAKNVSFDDERSNLMPAILSGGCGTGMHSIAYEKNLSKLLGELRCRS
jgi:hypothetical protein